MTDGLDVSALISALGGGGDLAATLSSALGNGELAAKLSSALGNGDLAAKFSSALSEEGAQGGSAGQGETLPAAGKSPDLSEILSALSGTQSKRGEKEDGNRASSLSALPSVVAALTQGGDERSKQRRALLSALRPFMSDRRKRAIDALVGIEKLTAVLPGVK